MRLRLRLDRMTLAVVALSVVTLHALLFTAGALMAPPAEESPLPAAVSVSAEPPPPAAPPMMAAALSPRAVPARAAAPRSVFTPRRSAPRPAYAARPLSHPLAFTKLRYGALLSDAAEKHDLSPLLLAAMTRVESDFDAAEVSHKGARGLMQVMPETGKRFGVHPELLFDPERNIAAGSAYMAWLLDRYRNDLDLALAAYNAGEGAVDKYRGIPPYRETQNYVRKVRAELRTLEARAWDSALTARFRTR